MLHPSYRELMSAINEGSEENEEPLVQSRYSIVLASAKRARQLNAGSEPMVDVKNPQQEKNLSIAVEELYAGKIHVINDESEFEEELEEQLNKDIQKEEHHN